MMSVAQLRAKYLILVLCLGFISICQAIGFGDLKLYSYLGEPLYAEIEITGYEGVDAEQLQVSLGSAKDFMRAGIDRPYFLTNLVFQVITYEKKLVVVARTNKPVQIPYLEFLVELSWPGGNLVKEYTILLDPPAADLSTDNRSKGYAQKAEEEAKQAAEGLTPIQQQMNIQRAQEQKAAVAATLANVVKDGNKYSDQTFETPIKSPAANELLPGEVPDVLDDQQVYTEQRQKFEKQLQQTNAQPTTLLQQAVAEISQIKQADAPLDLAPGNQVAQAVPPTTTPNNVPLAPPAAPMPATLPPVAPTPPKTEEPVDFNQVIKPATGGVAAKPPAPEMGATVAPTPAPVPEKSNLLYLGIILSLLLIAVALVIAIKRGLLQSILAKRAAQKESSSIDTEEVGDAAEVPFGEDSDEHKLARAIDEFAATEEETEQIELATMPATGATPIPPVPPVSADKVVDADLAEFEEDFASINLDELGVPQEPTTPEIPKPGTPEPQKAPQPEINPPETPRPPAAPPPEVPPTPQAPPKPEIPPTPVPPPAKPEITPPPNRPEITPTPTEIPKPPPEIAPPPPMEVPSSTPDVVPPTTPGSTPTVDTVVGPTMAGGGVNELKLSAEGASLVSPTQTKNSFDNQESLQIKLNLAKQYIDTGDKESAKELLREIIEVANEEQKLVAQILLSSIL